MPNGWLDHGVRKKRREWNKMKLGTHVGLGPGHIVLDGDPTPPPKGHSRQFSAHICCGQIVGWIKMPLGIEVGLSLGDFVLDGDPAPPSPKRGGASLPCFWPMSIVAERLDGSKYHLVELVPGHTVLDGDPAPPKRAQQPPHFGPCLLWPNGRPSSGFQVQCSKFCR